MNQRGRIQAWLGNQVPAATNAASFISDVVTFFVDYTIIRTDHSHRNVYFRDDFTMLADLVNIKCSFPLEKTYELPFFTGCAMIGTLRDIATFEYIDPRVRRHHRHESDSYYNLIQGRPFSMENLTHDEQVTRARGNLEDYLAHINDTDKCNRYENFAYDVYGDVYDDMVMDPDPGDENMSDADWDEWIISEYSRRDSPNKEEEIKIKTETGLRFPIFEKQIRDGLQSFFTNTLSSLTSEDPSITNPNFRLCRVAFRSMVEGELAPHRADMSIAHSATDFLQRIVEDICFGTVISPFRVHAPKNIGGSVCYCTVMMGDVHGTTMFCLQDCSAADENDNGDSSDSDGDYDPNLSDMEEESDDDDDDDDEQ